MPPPGVCHLLVPGEGKGKEREGRRGEGRGGKRKEEERGMVEWDLIGRVLLQCVYRVWLLETLACRPGLTPKCALV